MTRKQKKREGESYPKWVERLFPLWSKEQKEIVCEMLKTAYIDGVQLGQEVIIKTIH